MAGNENVIASREGKPDTTGYVTQLETRLGEKDEVIGLLKGQLITKDKQLGELSDRFTSLSDRFADTQKLMGAMQRMLAPLLGRPTPIPRIGKSRGLQRPILIALVTKSRSKTSHDNRNFLRQQNRPRSAGSHPSFSANRETNILIRGLQVGLLLGPSRGEPPSTHGHDTQH